MSTRGSSPTVREGVVVNRVLPADSLRPPLRSGYCPDRSQQASPIVS